MPDGLKDLIKRLRAGESAVAEPVVEIDDFEPSF